MTIVVRKPGRPAAALNRIFDEFFGPGFPGNTGGASGLKSAPAVNIVELPEAFRIDLSAPGLGKEDFQVRVEKDSLTIAGTFAPEMKEGETYRRREFGPMDFERRFRLPKDVDASGIGASYLDGILTVILPKREEAKEKPARQITVA